MALRRLHDLDILATDVDRRQCSRSVPMKVLALGMCRTGTESLAIALKALGIHEVYHGYHCALGNPRDCEIWLAGLRAKYEGVGRSLGRADFDRLLGHCQAVSDFPAIAFGPELIQAYPDAKIILNTRDVASWERSMTQTFQKLLTGSHMPLLEFLDRLTLGRNRWLFPTWRIIWKHVFKSDLAPLSVLLGTAPGELPYARQAFAHHYEEIEALVPADRLLRFEVGDGWGPLCAFLGLPCPEIPFPSGNSPESFHGRFRAAIRLGIYNSLCGLCHRFALLFCIWKLLHRVVSWIAWKHGWLK